MSLPPLLSEHGWVCRADEGRKRIQGGSLVSVANGLVFWLSFTLSVPACLKEFGSKPTELPISLTQSTRMVVDTGQTYRCGPWYVCPPALRIASIVCSVVSSTVVLMALTCPGVIAARIAAEMVVSSG